MDAEQLAKILARRRRGKQWLAGALLAFAVCLAIAFAVRSMWLMIPALLAWLVACAAAAYTGKAPARRLNSPRD